MSDVPRPESYAPFMAVDPERSWGEAYRHSSSGSSVPPHEVTHILGEAEMTSWRLRMAMIQVRVGLASAQVILLCCLLPTLLLARELFFTGGSLSGTWSQLAPAALVLCVFATVAATARMLALFTTLRELYGCMAYLRDALAGATVDMSPLSEA